MDIKIETITEELLNEIQRLDKVAYDFQVDLEWYKVRYINKGVCITARECEVLVGYLVFVGITDKLYQAFIKGTIQGDELIDPICYKSIEKADNIYIASVVVKEGYRNQGIATRLTEKVTNSLSQRRYI